MDGRLSTSRRRFLQGAAGLAGLATTGLLRRTFAGTLSPTARAAAHLVVMTVADKDHVWYAKAHVGDDPTVPAKVVRFADADGKAHRGLQAWFYADCVEAGATSLDNAYDYINCRSVTVTRDGKDIPVPPSSKKDGTFDFWRGCRCPAIRYGKQVGWSKDAIDWSLLPSYAKDVQAPWDDSKMDYSFNGMGDASMAKMGSAGSRPDLGYMPVWNMAFLTNPTDETWGVVRRTEDHIGWWGMVYTSAPDTGHIVDMYKYPGTTLLPQAQVHAWKNNALVPYGGGYDGDTLVVGKGGPRSWETTGSPFEPSTTHLTGYAMLAAMVTGTARDRDHASFWANYPIVFVTRYAMTGSNSIQSQRRAAWCLRDMFMASFVSSDCAYFAKETARNLPLVMAHATNPVGALDTHTPYPRKSAAAGGKVAVAPWMQYYLCTTIDAMSNKLPEWKPFAQFLAKFMVNWVSCPLTALASIGSFTVKTSGAGGAAQQTMDDFVKQASMSLARFGYTDEQIATVAAATTEQDCYDVLKAAQAAGGIPSGAAMNGKCVDGASDFIGYLGSDDAYGAMAGAAMVCAYNSGAPGARAVIERWKRIPTKPDFSHDCKYNLVPRV